MRVGLGFDVHPFDSSRPLIIGGVMIEAAAGLAGWSDGDVLCHAIADGLLGAAGLGDLGEHFPPEKVEQGSSSLRILSEVSAMLAARGLRVANIDSTVVLQEPRLAPYIAEMAATVAEALKMDPGHIGVKATTTDHLGFTGRNEGAAAIAVALIQG